LIEKLFSATKSDNFHSSNAQDRSFSMNSTSRQLGWKDRKQFWNEKILKIFSLL